MTKLIALYDLTNDGVASIRKGRKYELKEDEKGFYVYDDNLNKFYLSELIIQNKFYTIV